MHHLHQEFEAGPDDLVEVTLDGPANVMLLDSTDYEHYRTGEPFRYYGGHAPTSPMRLTPPHWGRWHIVVDLGGSAGAIRADLRVYRDANVAR